MKNLLNDPVFTFLLGLLIGVIVGGIATEIQNWARNNL